MQLKLGTRVLSLDRPLVMGILNVTPDSFSDGGQFVSAGRAMAHAAAMADAGADIVDVGGESTRPGAVEVSEQEELDRVVPVIEGITSAVDVAISVDTCKPSVMRAAVGAGAGMINDVFALQKDGALDTAADLEAAICLMHMLGTPGDMQLAPHYDELPGDVIRFLRQRVAACVSAGIDRQRLIVDPGFGFGKNDRHNLQILAALSQFTDLGLPLLVGLSRKRTLGNLSGKPVNDRVAAGIAAAVIAVVRGANIVRTHDVAETVDALRLFTAVEQAGSGA